MAKKEDLKTQRMDPDDDLDFSMDFDADSFLSPEASSKDRSPVSETFSGILGGVTSTVFSPAQLGQMTRKALPDSYGEVIDTVDTVTSGLSSLYDDVAKELRPAVTSFTKSLDDLVPKDSKVLRPITERLRRLVGEDRPTHSGPSLEEQQSLAIETSLGEIFSRQEQKEEIERKEDVAKSLIEDKVEEKRFEANIGVLGSIDKNISRLTQYNDQVNQAYQKKSLELQFRSYFALSNIARISKESFEVFKSQNESIVKNTGLPEYVKIQDSERFKDLTKSRITGKLYDSASDIISGGLGRMREAVLGKVSEYSDLLEQAAMAATMVAEQRSMSESMGISSQNMIGELIGSNIGERLTSGAGKQLKELFESHPGIARLGLSLKNIIDNPAGYLRRGLDSKGFEEFKSSGRPEEMMGNLIQEVASYFIPSGERELAVGARGTLGQLDDVAHFDNRVRTSIVDIIPGYLSYIHREIAMLRTGNDKIDRLTFDHDLGRFSSRDKVAARVKAKIDEGLTSTSVERGLEQSMAAFGMGPERLTKAEQIQLQRFFLSLSRVQSLDLTPENVLKTKAADDLSEGLRYKLSDSLAMRLGNKERGAEYESAMIRSMANLRNVTPDIRRVLEEEIKAGNADILEDEGIIKRSGDGYVVDRDKYYEYIKERNIDPDRIVDSDIDVKESITAFKGGGFLDKVRRTKLFNWKYRAEQGLGDEEHIGPMAQSVRANFGDETAPDGRAIDLVSLNGQTMAAVQELADRQDEFLGTSGPRTTVSVLEEILLETQDIRDDTYELVELAQGGGLSIGGGSGLYSDSKDYHSLLGNVTRSITEFTSRATGDLLTSAGNILSFGKDSILKPTGSFIADMWKNRDGTLGSRFRDLVGKGFDAVGGVFGSIRDLTTKTMPQMATSAYDWLVGKFDDMKDLYLPGMATPVIQAIKLKAGHYYDEAGKRTITTMEQLREVKGNVLDELGNVVLTAEDLARGLVDIDGKKIRSRLTRTLTLGFGAARAIGKRAWTNLSKAGSAIGKIAGKAGGALKDGLKGVFGTMTDAWKNMDLSGFFGGFADIFGMNNQQLDSIHDRLVEIRDHLLGNKPRDGVPAMAEIIPFPGTQAVNESMYESDSHAIGAISSVATKAGRGLKKGGKDAIDAVRTGKGARGKILGAAAALGGGLKDAFTGKDTEDEDQNEQDGSTASKAKSKTDVVDQDRARRAAAREEEITALGESKMDAVAVAQRQQDIKAQRQRNLAEDQGPKYKGKNVIDTMMEQAQAVIAGIGSALGSVLDFLGSSKTVQRLTSGLGRWISKIPGMSRLGGLISKIPGAKAIGGLLSRAPGLTTVARAAPLLSTAGSAAASTGVAAAASGAGTMLAGAAATVGSILASPAVLTGLAIGAVAAGGYFAYKWFTRRKVHAVDKLRFLQYGFSLSKDNEGHFKDLLQLESLIEKKGLNFSGGVPSIELDEDSVKDIFKIFKIKPEEHDRIEALSNFLDSRFKPVFLSWVGITHGRETPLKLEDLDKLKADERNDLLGELKTVRDYSEAVNPFNPDNVLPKRLEEANEYADSIMDKKALEAKAKEQEIQSDSGTGLVGGVSPSQAVDSALDRALDSAEQLKKDEAGDRPGLLSRAAGAAFGRLKNLVTNPVGTLLGDAKSLAGGVWQGIKDTFSAASIVAGAVFSPIKTFNKVRHMFKVGMKGVNASKLETVRLAQYGLGHTKRSKRHDEALLMLELYLERDVVIRTDLGAELDESKLDMDTVLKIFRVSKGDLEQVQLVQYYLKYRFLPFFINAVEALHVVDSSLRLKDLNSLKGDELLEYIDLLEYDSGPYDYVLSPFKDLGTLNNNVNFVKNILQNMRGDDTIAGTDLGNEISPEEPGPNTPQAISRNRTSPVELNKEASMTALANANKVIEMNKQTPTPVNVSEDGGQGFEAPTSGGRQDPLVEKTMGGSGFSQTPGMAAGELSDGSQGMQYLTFSSGENIDTLNPAMKQLFLGMVEEYYEKTGKKVGINSGSRTYEQQAALFKKYGSGRAAKPGNSLHEFGLALDINTVTLNEMDKLGLLKKYGFTRPVGGETWHMEPAGIQQQIQQAKNNPELASQLVMSGIYRGGGGFGSKKGPVGGRDHKLAKQLFDAPTNATVEEIDALKQFGTAGSTMAANDNSFNTPATPPGYGGSQTASQGSPQGSFAQLQDKLLSSHGGDVNNVLDFNAQAQQVLGQGGADLEPDALGWMADDGDMGDVGGDIKDQITAYARQAGMDPKVLQVLAAIESGMDPNARAKTSSATGLFQFIKGTWSDMVKKHGGKYNIKPGTSPTDVRASTLLAAEYLKGNQNTIKSVRPNPGITDMYLTHFLGPGGARKFLSANPNEIAANVLPKPAAANRSIFYDNGRPRTIAQVYKLLSDRLTKRAQEFGIGSVSPGQTPRGAGGQTGGAGASGGWESVQQEPVANATELLNSSDPFAGIEAYSTPASPSMVRTPSEPSQPMFSTAQPSQEAQASGIGTDLLETIGAEGVEISKQMLDELKAINENVAKLAGVETGGDTDKLAIIAEHLSKLVELAATEDSTRSSLPERGYTPPSSIDLTRRAS